MSIKFSEFLSEKYHTAPKIEKKSIEEGIALLNRYCKDGLMAINEDKLLFRGSNNLKKNKIAIIDSSRMERSSRDRSGAYQLLMEGNPNFKGFPSRFNSIICSESPDFAENYGALYAIIPFDGITVATCYLSDFLDVVDDKSDNDIGDIDNYARGLLSHWKLRRAKYLPEDIPKINKILKSTPPNQILEDINEYMWCNTSTGERSLIDLDFNSPKFKRNLTSFGRQVFEVLQNSNQPWQDISSLIMSPKNLEMRIGKFGELKPTGESWFTGKCVAIHIDVFLGIVEELNKSYNFNIPYSIYDFF